jgi:hypothetical protein
MSDQRMQALTKDVVETARVISEDLGWTRTATDAVGSAAVGSIAVGSTASGAKKRAGVGVSAPREKLANLPAGCDYRLGSERA